MLKRNLQLSSFRRILRKLKMVLGLVLIILEIIERLRELSS